MEEKKVSTMFEEMREDIGKYITSTLELGKLEIYEKFSLGSSALIYGLLLGGITLLALQFIFITVGLYLGDLLNSFWIGFGIVAGFAILILLILLLSKKPLQKNITNRIVSFLMKKDDNE